MGNAGTCHPTALSIYDFYLFLIYFQQLQPIQKMNHNHTITNQPMILIGDGDDKEMLKQLGIDTSVAIIAGTDDDTNNLSILATAKKLNPNIITIARENELEDFSIFESSNIDTIFIPAKVLIYKTVNAILNPSLDLFIRHVHNLNEEDVILLTKKLLEINLHPLLFTLKIDDTQAPMLVQNLPTLTVQLSLLKSSLKNRNSTNNLIPLMRVRNKKVELLPSWESTLEKNDLFLFAGDANAQDHLEYIANNFYEFHYAYYGEEKSFFNKLWKKEPISAQNL